MSTGELISERVDGWWRIHEMTDWPTDSATAWQAVWPWLGKQLSAWIINYLLPDWLIDWLTESREKKWVTEFNK